MAAWIEAGELLIEIKKDNPNAFQEILKTTPGLSIETLHSFERIGRREIYPPLLLNGSMGAKKLLTLPYAEQERLCDAEISVAVIRRGEVVSELKKVSELTAKEAEVAFTDSTLRPIKEQFSLVHPKTRGYAMGSRRSSDMMPETSEVEEENETADGKLAQAQAALIRARELLEEGKIVYLDRFITAALNAVGKLRFELSEVKSNS